MFNSSARRQAIDKLQKAAEKYESLRKGVEHASVWLFEQRQRAATEVIKPVEDYVNLLANSPKEFDRSVAELRVAVNRFNGDVQSIKAQAANATVASGATGAAGAAAGVGVVVLGPSAAMAIATTFGTASTGTAISALSGAAATNAALAWLGGGALAAGGGGMAAGNTLLALAGPVGWTIAGVALVGSGIYFNSKNKKAAEEATRKCIQIEAGIRTMHTAHREVDSLRVATEKHNEGCLDIIGELTGHRPKSGSRLGQRTGGGAPLDYRQFNLNQKQQLAALINHTQSLSKLIRKEVSFGKA